MGKSIIFICDYKHLHILRICYYCNINKSYSQILSDINLITQCSKFHYPTSLLCNRQISKICCVWLQSRYTKSGEKVKLTIASKLSAAPNVCRNIPIWNHRKARFLSKSVSSNHGFIKCGGFLFTAFLKILNQNICFPIFGLLMTNAIILC